MKRQTHGKWTEGRNRMLEGHCAATGNKTVGTGTTLCSVCICLPIYRLEDVSVLHENYFEYFPKCAYLMHGVSEVGR